MAVVRIKPGASIQNPAPAGLRILSALDQLAALRDRDVVITSGDEGDWRQPTDPHKTGEAFDISVAAWSEDDILDGYQFLNHTLGAAFTVLFEAPPAAVATLSQPLQDLAYVNAKATGIHFHLQRKRGTHYP